MDPPDKDPDPDTLNLPGYPIRPRPTCRAVKIILTDFDNIEKGNNDSFF